MKNKIKWISATASFFLLGGCNDNSNPLSYQENTHSRGKIEVYADESFKPLFDTSISTFESQFPKAHIKMTYLPELDVINTFLKQKAETIFMTRDFTAKEKAKLKKSLIEVRSEKLAIDAVALIVHPDNVDTNLTIEQVKGMLTGFIPQWPTTKQKVNIVFDKQNSANFLYMSELIGNAPFSENVYTVKSNKEVINYVKKHPNAVGVIGINWISDEDDPAVLDFLDGITVVSLAAEGSEDFYKPYQSFIYTKEYPLTRELWAINMASRSGLNTGFINYLMGEKGQLIIQKSSLVPTNSPVRMMEIEM